MVQLPQSIHFDDTGNVEATRALLHGHPSFTLMVRDDASQAVAEERLRHPAVLCPDVAFALGPMVRPGAPEVPVVLLSRDDKEGAARRPAARWPARVDWVDEPDAPLLHRLAERWRRAGGPVPAALRPASVSRPGGVPDASRCPDACARPRRRHQPPARQILAMLMGIPHFVSDTRQGKLSAFHRTWLAGSMPDVMCASEEDALRRAAGAGAIAGRPNRSMRLVETGGEERGGRRRTTALVLWATERARNTGSKVPPARDAGHPVDPWAIALLPLAMTRGESLEIPLPVDPVLLAATSTCCRASGRRGTRPLDRGAAAPRHGIGVLRRGTGGSHVSPAAWIRSSR